MRRAILPLRLFLSPSPSSSPASLTEKVKEIYGPNTSHRVKKSQGVILLFGPSTVPPDYSLVARRPKQPRRSFSFSR